MCQQWITVFIALCASELLTDLVILKATSVWQRSLPIEEQQGAIHCTKCQRWFHSKGGFTVHKFTAAEVVS